MAEARMIFRKCLLQVSRRLTRQDLDQMKFLCKDAVPVSRMERVVSGTELFAALQEVGKLSPDDLGYLTRVLEAVGRRDVLEELSSKFNLPPTNEQAEDRQTLFSTCLVKLVQSLSAQEVSELVFQWADSILNVSSDQVFSATQLFQLLLQRQHLTPVNVNILYDGLTHIGRRDLCELLDEYLRSAKLPPVRYHDNQTQNYQHQNQGGVRPPCGGDYYSSVVHPQQATPDFPDGEPQGRRRSFPPPSRVEVGVRVGNNRPQHLLHTPTSPPFTPSPLPPPSSSSSSSNQPFVPIPSGHTHAAPPPPCGDDTPPYQHYHHSPLSSELNPHYSMSDQSMARSTYLPYTRDGGGPFPNSNFSPVFPPAPLAGTAAATTLLRQQVHPPDLSFVLEEEGEEGGRDNDDRSKFEMEWRLRQTEEQAQQLKQDLENSMNSRLARKDQEHLAHVHGLEEVISTKNREVEELRRELQDLNMRMHTVHAGLPISNDELYKMNCNPHGVCLIINNHRFHHPTNRERAHPERAGAIVDQHNLVETFRYLNYRVEVEENLTSHEMRQKLLDVSVRDHSCYDSFVCCILTHGEVNAVHGADSQAVDINDLTGSIKQCISLVNKPKLFFIQACRGNSEDEGMPVEKDGNQPGQSLIPKDADFFLGFATPSGQSAYRSRRHGSWFISELCQVFAQLADTHTLGSMMKRVNLKVSQAYTKEGQKQCTESVDRLRKDVHFSHFYGSSS